MNTKFNKNASHKMSILCVGCSWSLYYPKYITDVETVHWEGIDGGSLWKIGEKLKKLNLTKYRYVFVQLPTPIRTFVSESKVCITAKVCRKFIESFDGTPERVAANLLLKKYKKQLLEIDKLKKVVFFIFNTGGYPFQGVYNFGEEREDEFIEFFIKNYIPHIKLHLGYQKKYYVSDTDCHPNKKAQQKAAKLIEEYLEEIELY